MTRSIAALAVGALGLVTIGVLQRLLPKIPAVLVAVLLSIVATKLFQLGEHGVSLVGTLPQGFPPLTLPGVGLSDLPLLLGGAAGIALVALADTIATSSAFAERTGQDVDGSQEMVGIGTANIAAGLFQGFPVSTSGSRTAVAEQTGAKTQLTGIVGCTRNHTDAPTRSRTASEPASTHPRGRRDRRLPLPRRPPRHDAALEAAPDRIRRVDRSLPRGRPLRCAARHRDRRGRVSRIAFRRSWWPYQTMLGRVEGLPGYHDLRSYPERAVLPGLVVFRFDAPLFFANARTFREQIRRLAAAEPPPTWILVAAEPITDVDTTAADMLEELDEAINSKGISLVFAEMKDPVRHKIERYKLTRTIDPGHFFPTLDAAITAFRQQTGANWTHTSGG